MNIQNAINLKTIIEEKKDSWDEMSQFEIRGVGNLSLSDLDTIEMYADSFINSGGVSFSGMMTPLGEVGEVLDAYGIRSLY